MYMLCVVVGVGGGGVVYMLCVVVGVGGGGRCVYVVCGCRGWWRGALCICCVWL